MWIVLDAVQGKWTSDKECKKKKTFSIEDIPVRPLTNFELEEYAKKLNISYFRGVFMRDCLPGKMWKNEAAIVNLDTSVGSGTHWVCYRKIGSNIYYFDSFGNLKPPQELVQYFNGYDVYYNYRTLQSYRMVICGHLCLRFLTENN